MASQINASNSGFGGIVSTGDSSGVLQLQTTGTTAVTIDTSQNVGIGTTSPTNKLTIGGTNSNIFFKNADATTGYAAGQIANTGGSFYFGLTSSTGAFWQNTAGNYAATIGTSNATNLSFATNDNVRMILDSSGNVGIGTTSPGAKLNIDGAASDSVALFTNNGTVSAGGNGLRVGIDNSLNAYVNNSKAGPLVFSTSNTERMRIDSSGNVLVGTTTAATLAGTVPSFQAYTASGSAKFIAGFNNASTNDPVGIVISYTGMTRNTATSEFIYCNDTSVLRMGVRSNGGIANYSANNVNLSDAREKTNIELAGSYLDKICAIPVKTFNYIDQNMEEDGGLTLGVIAQDVQAVAPELVMESDWGTKEEPKERLSIYQTDLQYALMKCIQEQQTIINDLKARVTALEAK